MSGFAAPAPDGAAGSERAAGPEPRSRLRRFSRAVFGLFADMPHRGSGTHYEARAARILGRLAGEALGGRVDLEPFAVDLSSGAWNVALHGGLLCVFLLLDWGLGLGMAAAYGPGGRSVRLGFLGAVPLAFVAAAFALCLLFLFSRRMAGRKGWGIFSFFVPNADSADIVVSTLPALRDGASLRLEPAERWRRRFAASGKKRLIVFAAHYDSARCLPPQKGKGAPPRFLLAALKNGIGTIPTAAYLALALTFAAAGVLAFVDPGGALMGGPFGQALAALVLVALVVAAVEAAVAGASVNLPFQQGYNDDLSGVVAALGAFFLLAPGAGTGEGKGLLEEGIVEGAGRREVEDSALMVLLTGSEENGLRGSLEFAKRALAPALEVFGERGVLLVNLDSVSGGELVAAAGERNFTGAIRSGDPDFARKAVAFLRGPRLAPARAAEHLGAVEIERCLVPAEGGARAADGGARGAGGAADGAGAAGESGAAGGPAAYGYRIALEEEPLPACTDMTGFCSLKGVNRRLRAFTVVSRAAGSGPLPQPRDYHQPSDTFETLFLESEPENFGGVVALSLALADLAVEAGAGSFDGE